MIGTLIGSTVAEKADHDIVFLLHFKGQADSRCNGQVTAHNSIGRQRSYADISGMHGAAFTAAAAFRFAKHLAHHGSEGDSLCQIMAGRPVGTGHPVVLAQVVQHAHRAGFFTVALMQRAGHFTFQKQIVEPLFVFADLIHFQIHAKGFFFCWELTHVSFSFASRNLRLQDLFSL